MATLRPLLESRPKRIIQNAEEVGLGGWSLPPARPGPVFIAAAIWLPRGAGSGRSRGEPGHEAGLAFPSHAPPVRQPAFLGYLEHKGRQGGAGVSTGSVHPRTHGSEPQAHGTRVCHQRERSGAAGGGEPGSCAPSLPCLSLAFESESQKQTSGEHSSR